MQGESRWPRRCGSETRNSPIHAGLENQAAEDQETQVYLSAVVLPPFQLPKIRHFPKSRHPIYQLTPFVSVPSIWHPRCIFVNRQPRSQPCSNAMAEDQSLTEACLDQSIVGPSKSAIVSGSSVHRSVRVVK